MQKHLYYLPYGESTQSQTTRHCQTCTTEYPAQLDDYEAIAPRTMPLDALKMWSNPAFDQRWEERVELEKQILQAPLLLEPAQRHALIREVFMGLSADVEKRYASVHLDWQAGLAILAALAFMICSGFLGLWLTPDDPSIIMWTVSILSIVFVFYCFYGVNTRYMRGKLTAKLAVRLLPLRPSQSELRTVIKELGDRGYKIATKLNLEGLKSPLRW